MSSGKVFIILRPSAEVVFFFNRASKTHILDFSFAPDPLSRESKESPPHLDARQLGLNDPSSASAFATVTSSASLITNRSSRACRLELFWRSLHLKCKRKVTVITLAGELVRWVAFASVPSLLQFPLVWGLFKTLKTSPLPCCFVTSLLSLVVHFENSISFHFRAKLVIWRLENGRSRKRNPIKSERSASYKMGWRKQGRPDMTISYTRKVRKGWGSESVCPFLMHT